MCVGMPVCGAGCKGECSRAGRWAGLDCRRLDEAWGVCASLASQAGCPLASSPSPPLPPPALPLTVFAFPSLPSAVGGGHLLLCHLSVRGPVLHLQPVHIRRARCAALRWQLRLPGWTGSGGSQVAHLSALIAPTNLPHPLTVDAYNEQLERQGMGVMLTEGQKEWVKSQLHLLRDLPEKRGCSPRQPLRRKLHTLVMVRACGAVPWAVPWAGPWACSAQACWLEHRARPPCSPLLCLPRHPALPHLLLHSRTRLLNQAAAVSPWSQHPLFDWVMLAFIFVSGVVMSLQHFGQGSGWDEVKQRAGDRLRCCPGMFCCSSPIAHCPPCSHS